MTRRLIRGLWQHRATALWLLLILPPVRGALEQTMTRQMLLQLPLLALAGAWLRPQLPARLVAALARWNRSGISGLLLASLAAMVWMLPRAMDAALMNPWVAGARLTSVPLLIGWPLALSWPAAGFVVRGVFVLESIATALRLGWLYCIAPERLCSNYLLHDQQQLGHWLLAIAAVASIAAAWKLLAGPAPRAHLNSRIDVHQLRRDVSTNPPYGCRILRRADGMHYPPEPPLQPLIPSRNDHAESH